MSIARQSYQLAFNKDKTLKSAAKLGIPIPKTFLLNSLEELREHAEELQDFPYFVKHTKARAYRADGTAIEPVIARDASALYDGVAALSSFSTVIIQEKIEGHGVGIEVLCDHGKILASIAHERIHELPLTGGGSSYRKTIEMPPELLQHTQNLLQSWNWHGVAMVEYKCDENRFALMEVNGRFWGSLPLAIRAGVDFPKLLIDLMEGKSIPQQTYKVGIHSRQLKADVLWMKANFRADSYNLDLLTRPTLRSVGEYFLPLFGKEFWDHVYFSDPKIFLNIVHTTVIRELRGIGSRLVRKSVILRSRTHSKRLIEKLSQNDHIHIESVCYGNICRSPLAEHILNAKELKNISVSSSGFHQVDNRMSPETYQQQVNLFDIDLSNHFSSMLTMETVEKADLILLMDYKNWRLMEAMFGSEVLNKCILLGSLSTGPVEIADPYHEDIDTVTRTIKQLFHATEALSSVLTDNNLTTLEDS